MKCEPLKLHVDPNATPTAVHKPALVPIHWQNKVYEDLERDVRIGVLERVDPTPPPHNMVFQKGGYLQS